MSKRLLLWFGLAVLCVSCSRRQSPSPGFVETATRGEHVFHLVVGGSVDEENTRNKGNPYRMDYPSWDMETRLSITNLGEAPVHNPNVLANHRGPAFSMEELLGQILRPDDTDAEKARALYEFVCRTVVHGTIGPDSTLDPLRLYNGVGFALCYENSVALARLWSAAGLESVAGAPVYHQTAQVRYDGRTHLLDGNERIYFLAKDNRTLVGEEDLVADPDLVMRSPGHWPLYLLNQGWYAGDLRYQAMQLYSGTRSDPRYKGNPPPPLSRFYLRPGESLLWDWAYTKKAWRYPGITAKYARDRLFASGRIEYAAPVDESFLRQEGVSHDGTLLRIRTVVPTILTGGTVSLRYSGDVPAATISFDGKTSRTVTWAVSGNRCTVDLDPLLDVTAPRAPAYVQCILNVVCPRNALGKEIRSYSHSLSLQVHRKALPSLRAGTNTIRYTDDTEGERRVRIAYSWKESESLTAPPPPIPAEPAGDVRSLQPVFRWTFLSEAERNRVREVHVQVCDREDLRWPVSNAFDPSYKVAPGSEFVDSWRPHRSGLVSPDRRYYWRVRVRSDEGVWSTWSETLEFVPHGPLPPENLKVVPVGDDISIEWTSAQGGTKPVRYEVHGSPQFGFTAYIRNRVFLLGDRTPPKTRIENFYGDYPTTQTPTLIGVTEGLSYFPFTEGQEMAALPCFCRVIAVDEHGARSDSSGQVELPHPWLVAPKTATVAGDRSFSFRARSNESLGRFYAKSTARANYDCDFWDREAVTVQLDSRNGIQSPAGGIDWLRIDSDGTVSGAVPDGVSLPLTIAVVAKSNRGRPARREIQLIAE